MKKLMMWALAVVPFAVLAVATSSASAAFEYLCGGQAILTAGNCLTLSVNLGPITLEDMSVPAGVYCVPEKVTDEDEILSPTVDDTTVVTFAEKGHEPGTCKPLAKALNLENKEAANGCTKVDEVAPVNLPWETKIEEEEAGPLWWVLIKKGTGAAGEPGYLTECETALGLVDDTCKSETETALILVESLPESETIEGASVKLISGFFTEELLNPKTEPATCTIGGKESGLVVGEVLIWAIIDEAGGASLTASLEIS